MIKKLLLSLVLLTSLSVPLTVNAEESLHTDVHKPDTPSFVKVSPYVYEITYESPIQNGADFTTLSESNDITLSIDFSESTFYDEEGNIVDKDEVMKTIVPINETNTGGFIPFGASYTPGSLSTGSGYAVNKGMKITGKEGVIVLNIEYRADITRVNQGYDRIDRIYGATVWGGGSWDWISQGVFRRNETLQYSAYGGVKGQWDILGYGTTTKYLYLRVGNDRIWLDHNIK